MDPDFWHERWAQGETGFHRDDVNPVLERNAPTALPAPPARIFVPLCGKTRDIGWLLSQGYDVVGAELSDIAITQLFADLGVTPSQEKTGALTRFTAGNLVIYQGNIFDLSDETLGHVDAIYDRAALTALPPDMRLTYARHLVQITGAAAQLLITLSYDQSLADGPPFSIDGPMIGEIYQADYEITVLEDFEIEGGVKGGIAALDHVRHLIPRS